MSDDFEALRERALRLRRQGARGRYAPSPTGPLHLGNARTALLAWLQARLRGGAFIMRMEDLDRPRVRSGSAAQILDDLRWLGLDWDEGPDVGGPVGPYEQSKRDGLYKQAFAQLEEKPGLFPCFCSRKDIARAASAPHAPAGAYPGTCRRLSADERLAALDGKAKRPSWRYPAPDRRVAFEDAAMGPFAQNLARDVGDYVVRRADGLFAYQLAVVVDDGLMGVTDVARGADLLDSTPRQIELFEALGFPAPEFWHLPLMLDASGERMAKRDGSDSIAAYREAGGRSARLVGELAATLGLVPAGTVIGAAELLRALDLATFRAAVQGGLSSG